MLFIRSILISVLKSLIVLAITWVAAMSFFQQKFPPTFMDPRASIKQMQQALEQISKFNAQATFDKNIDPDSLITSRTQMMNEVNKMDSAEVKPVKKSAVPAGKEIDLFRTRLDISEYKIRLLEFEITQLKNELKKSANKSN